jgi:peptidoglycan/LPS O-acetylase OafA/YrhL
MRSKPILIAAVVLTVLVEVAIVALGFTSNGEHIVLSRLPGTFVLGCLLGRLFLLDPSPGGGHWTAVTLGTALLASAAIVTLPLNSVSPNYVIPLFGVLIFALAMSSGSLRRVMSAPVAVFMGEASYALYMTHFVVNIAGAKVLPLESFVGASAVVKMLVIVAYAVAVLGAAIATYLLVERPARRVLRALVLRRRSASPIESRR